MDRRRSRISRWLGGPATRRRRHRRAAGLGVLLLLVAALLIALGADDDDFTAEATEACAAFGERVSQEFELSFPEGAPLTNEAGAEYLSHAFADTMEELVGALRELSPPDAAAQIVEDLAARIEEVRAEPDRFVLASPLDGIAERFDDVDLAACGSGFFAPPE